MSWFIRRPDSRFLELDDGHWGWTSNAAGKAVLSYPTKQEAQAAMRCARNCGIDWPGMHVAEFTFRKLELH